MLILDVSTGHPFPKRNMVGSAFKENIGNLLNGNRASAYVAALRK